MSDQPPLELLLSKYFKTKAVQAIQDHPELIEQILPICLTDKPPMCWRAAWVIRSAVDKNDAQLIPYIDRILQVLPKKEDGHQRELMKLLQKAELSEDQESVLYDISVSIWESVGKQPSVRYVAFENILAMVRKYPDLRNELEAITQPQYLNSLSPGIKKGITKSLAEIESNR
ncbi:MAG: hypothetical protein JJ895_02910 [Balneolaceae bacterium]|nr:hypothetical protein [Balneolaceae bacterium]